MGKCEIAGCTSKSVRYVKLGKHTLCDPCYSLYQNMRNNEIRATYCATLKSLGVNSDRVDMLMGLCKDKA